MVWYELPQTKLFSPASEITEEGAGDRFGLLDSRYKGRCREVIWLARIRKLMRTKLKERSFNGPDGASFHCMGAEMVTVRFFWASRKMN